MCMTFDQKLTEFNPTRTIDTNLSVSTYQMLCYQFHIHLTNKHSDSSATQATDGSFSKWTHNSKSTSKPNV